VAVVEHKNSIGFHRTSLGIGEKRPGP
jgi:hypothetical protein